MLFPSRLFKQSIQAVGKIWLIKRLFVLQILLTVLCSTLVLFFTLITQQPNGINIERVILTSDLRKTSVSVDPKVNFDPNTPRIYAIIYTGGIFGLHLKTRVTVKWFYKDEQISSHLLQVSSRNPAIIFGDYP